MEKYNVMRIDVPHDAITGVRVGRIQGLVTVAHIARSIALGAGEVALQLKHDAIEGAPFYKLQQAIDYVIQQRRPALFIEDTNELRPNDLERITWRPTVQWWSNGTEWTKSYRPVCCLCHFNLFESEQIIDGLKGYRAHVHCPDLDEDGKFIEESIQAITDFVFTHTHTVRAVIYKDRNSVEHSVPITIAEIRSHMSSSPEEYKDHKAAFRCQSVSPDGEMYNAEFLGLIYEEAKK